MTPLLLLAAIAGQSPPLPPPNATPSVTKHPKVVGWPDGKTPTAPAGFSVTLFADKFDNPRWTYVLPNGDILLSEARTVAVKAPKEPTGRLVLLRDADKDGKPEVREVFAEGDGVRQPFGMAVIGNTLFVANTDSVVAYEYEPGQTKAKGKPRYVAALPAQGYNNHWTRNLLAKPDGSKLYVTVGSASNVGENGMEHELLRACVLEMNPDGTALRVFASGLRNPVGLAWEPTSGTMWTAVNERDHLGDDLVPDYMTSVKDGAFYGWPYAYFGGNEDPRRKGERPDLVAKTVAPDVPLGAHTASLGLAFVPASPAWPAKYHGGAVVGQRGSWNRSQFAGYKVAFVPFKDGKPSGPPEDFLAGFIKDEKEVYGRPVGVTFAPDGALLVCDDASRRIWRVAPAATK